MLRSLKSEYAAGDLLRIPLVPTIKIILLLLLALLFAGSRAQDDKYQLQVKPIVRAQKGLCVFLSCYFTFPKDGLSLDYTYGFWYRQYRNYNHVNTNRDLVATNDQTKNVSPRTQGRFKLVGSPEDGNCSLLITNVQESDQGVYFFRVERGNFEKYSYIMATVSLEVIDQTQPDIYILEPLWPNSWGTILCVFSATFDGCPAPTFSWTGPVLSTSRSQVNAHRSSVLKIAPRPQDQGTSLTCRVSFAPQGRIFQKTVWLDVGYAPKDLVIRVSQVKGAAPQSLSKGSHTFNVQAQQGSFVQLLCETSSHPPASLSWTLEDRVLSSSNPKDPQALVLELPSVQVGDSGSYTCCAENELGQKVRVVQLEVQHAPEDLSVTVSIENGTVLQILQKANTLGVLQGQSLQLHCAARSSPPARLSWTRGPLSQSPVLPSELGLLLLPRIQPDQEGEFTCQAQNQLGSQQVSVTIHVYYEKGTLRGAFSNGVLVGTGIAGFLSLCVILILVIFLRRRGKQTKQMSRRSTILDYINVFPRSGSQTQHYESLGNRSLLDGSQAPNQEAEPHGPSQPPLPASNPQPRKNLKWKQKCQEEDCARSHAEATPPQEASQNQEVQYSHLYFPGRRPQVLQAPNDSHEEYVEIRFH